MDFAWNTYYIFGVWRFYRFVFEERSNLLSFGFILLGWTMMFLYINLQGLLLWFQWAQDHQKRSLDDQIMVVLVSAVSAFSRAGDSSLGRPETPAQNVFSPLLFGILARNLWIPFSRLETLAPKARAGHRDFQGGPCLWTGLKSFWCMAGDLGQRLRCPMIEDSEVSELGFEAENKIFLQPIAHDLFYAVVR
jgi:hypothetical protein